MGAQVPWDLIICSFIYPYFTHCLNIYWLWEGNSLFRQTPFLASRSLRSHKERREERENKREKGQRVSTHFFNGIWLQKGSRKSFHIIPTLGFLQCSSCHYFIWILFLCGLQSKISNLRLYFVHNLEPIKFSCFKFNPLTEISFGFLPYKSFPSPSSLGF